RLQERQAQANTERTAALYELAHETATALTMDDILRTAVTQIERVFHTQAGIFITSGNALNPHPHPSSTMQVDERDFSVATWVFENGRAAGRFTETLPLASAQFLPLRTPNRTVGVLGLTLAGDARPTFDQRML